MWLHMKLPENFVNLTEQMMGGRLWQTLLRGLTEDTPVSIRLNPLKCDVDGCELVSCDGRVPWCENGFYLKSRPNFTFDPLFHAGLYYVQEASSMFLDRVLRQHAGNRPLTALDLCAAPGGKSTVARTVLPTGSLLICNEPVRTRARILVENMMKFGHEDIIVTNNYPCDFRRGGFLFDMIIADVPCSGEGMFRKDDTAIGEWSLQNVEKCRCLQREIISDIWDCLKPDGLLVYSTCTFNLRENEENILYISEELGAEVLDVDVEGCSEITGSLLDGFSKPVFRFIPGLTHGEGLFMSVMRKHGDGVCYKGKVRNKKGRKGRKTETNDNLTNLCAGWLKRSDRFDMLSKGDTLVAVPKAWREVYDVADRYLNVLYAGVALGEVKGKDIIPSQALALSVASDLTSFGSVELDYNQAVSYLRKEAVSLPPDTPRGHILMTYKNMPLGFEKNIGNRANNLYPSEWRIKSTHAPEAYSEVIKIIQR